MAALLGEEIDDAVERLVGAVRVQRRDAQMPGLRELDAVLHRLAIANLADHDDVGRLAQRVLQRVVPAVGIDADLAVRHDAAAMRMHVLDRILDRDDVTAAVLVAVPDHRRERRRLARARAADDEAQARASSSRRP